MNTHIPQSGPRVAGRAQRQPAESCAAPDVSGRSVLLSSNSECFTRCARCGAPVKQKNIKSHVLRIHNSRSERITKFEGAGSSGRRPALRDDVFKEAFAQVNSLERRDKTRPYAHAFRENGRFGSHPIHDGFDDESGPE
jgi:hypothetical protein